MELTEEMEQAGFAALDEYEAMKANKVFPRPSLIAHLWVRMAKVGLREFDQRLSGEIALALTKRLVIDMPTARAAVEEALRNIPHHSAPDGEDLSHDFEDHDCGEDTCVCAAPTE